MCVCKKADIDMKGCPFDGEVKNLRFRTHDNIAVTWMALFRAQGADGVRPRHKKIFSSSSSQAHSTHLNTYCTSWRRIVSLVEHCGCKKLASVQFGSEGVVR
jgi:hypothetical protein